MMAPEPGYYSVIQYCPDRFRAEAVNVGVLLFVPGRDYLRARLNSDHGRARRVFGIAGAELDALKLAERAMEQRLNANRDGIATLDDLRGFAAARANDLRLVEPRLVMVGQFDYELARLYATLVEADPAARADRPAPVELLPPVLGELFYRLSQHQKVWDPGRIEVPVRGRRIEVPYAYQNGSLHLVKPRVFTPGKRADTQAADLAIDGDLLQRYPDEHGLKRRFVVVSTQENPEQAEAVAEQVAPVFREYDIRLVRPSTADDFAAEVEHDAH